MQLPGSLAGLSYSDLASKPAKGLSQDQLDSLRVMYSGKAQELDDAAFSEQQANTPRYQQWFKQKAQYDQQQGQPRLAGMVG